MEESQNKTAYQNLELLLFPLHALAENFGLVRNELARMRATVLEGSSGTQKEHYDLRRVKARMKPSLA